MVKFFLIPVIIMLSCGSTKTNQSAAKTDTVITEEPVMNQRDSAIIPQVTEATDAAMPKCIKNKIDSFKVRSTRKTTTGY